MLLVFLAVYLLSGFPQDCAGQRYVIVAPHTVRPHSTYEVLVTNLAKTVLQFRCEIVNSQDVPVRTQSVRVDPQRIVQADIDIGSLEEGKYKLKVWDDTSVGRNLGQLLNSTSLMFSSKSYTVLFQTDKPEYKPGDKVQFRVLFLLPNLRPVPQDVAPSVFITDPNGYRIQKWTEASLQNGVFEGFFQLAPHTTIGDWSISALVNDQHFSDTFGVAEYILPMFKVELNSIPKSFHCDQKNMELRLTARYMGGGMVHGNATIVARANYNNYPSQTKEVARRHVTLNGTTVVSFPTGNVTGGCDEDRNVWFDVEVMDSLTGVSYNLTKKIQVYSIPYNMEIIDEFEGFYPGLPINLKVRLSEADGSRMANETVTIVYKVINSDRDMDDGIRTRKQFVTNIHGIARLQITTTNETSSVHVEGNYKNITFQLLYAEPLYLEDGVKFLTANVRRAYHTVNDNVTINLDSNVSVRRIFYIGYCRGIVCTKGVVESENAKKRHTLVIAANSKMPPNMKLVVFSVLEDGEILSYPVIVQFTSVGINTFKVTWTQDQPGMYNFGIRAEKGAFVGLLGVDQSITLKLSSNNDITLRKIEGTKKDPEDSMILWSVHDSFGSLGATLLTDGYLTDVGNVYHGPGGAIAGSARNSLDDDIRQDFPETWIWESLTVADGKGSLSKRIPDTITTWVVTGFAVGQEHGLVVLKEPLYINNAKEVYAQLDAPASIKQFEEVEAICLIHNDGDSINVIVEVSPNLMTNHTLFLEKGKSKRVSFKLPSNTVGMLTVDVVVKTLEGIIIDKTRQSIAVHPAGEEIVAGVVRNVNFEEFNNTMFTMTVKDLKLPKSCRAKEVKFSIIGTLVNLNQYDLESMVAASFGNGGENLLFLQTTIAVYDYLNKADSLQPGKKEKLIGYIEVAYQQHLRFRLNDGSFSMFGTVRKCSSIWLTAATVETLLKARTYLAVDNSVIVEGLSWLAKQSQDDGSFRENCPIVYPHIQSTGGKELSLAASVMFAFVGNEYSEQYADLINKTGSLLTREPIEDVYVLAKTACLLRNDRTILKNLNDKIVKQGFYNFWRVSNQSQPPASENTRNQGATAYALLANLANQYTQDLSTDDLLLVAQWIQQNMFARELRRMSLEKVVALQALKSLQDRIRTETPNMTVQVLQNKLYLNGTNRELLQTVKLSPATRNMEVSVKGTGFAMLKLSYRCIVPPMSARKGKKPSGSTSPPDVNITKLEQHNYKLTQWIVCANFYVFYSKSPFYRFNIYLPTGLHLIKQSSYEFDNRTISASCQDGDSRLELVYIVTNVLPICFPVVGVTYYRAVRPTTGSIELCAMDGTDRCPHFKLD